MSPRVLNRKKLRIVTLGGLPGRVDPTLVKCRHALVPFHLGCLICYRRESVFRAIQRCHIELPL